MLTSISLVSLKMHEGREEVLIIGISLICASALGPAPCASLLGPGGISTLKPSVKMIETNPLNCCGQDSSSGK